MWGGRGGVGIGVVAVSLALLLCVSAGRRRKELRMIPRSMQISLLMKSLLVALVT